MGFFNWGRRRASRASSYVRRKVRRAYRFTSKKERRAYSWARSSVRRYAREYTTKVHNWKSKFSGKKPAEEEKNSFIETVSEQITSELVDSMPEKIEDPTGEVREIILADVMREVQLMVDAEIASATKPQRKISKMTDPQPDIP